MGTVPKQYIHANLHFARRTPDLGHVMRGADVAILDSRPRSRVRNCWTLRHVQVAADDFDKLRYALALGGIGELRAKGQCRIGLSAVLAEYEPR